MRIYDGLTKAHAGSQTLVGDLVVVERAADPEAREGLGTDKQTDVHMVSVVLIIYEAGAIDVGPYCVAGAVFKKIIQSQLARGDQTGNRDTDRSRGQQPPIAGELHDQRPVYRSKHPARAAKFGVVIPNAGLIPAQR